MKILLQKIVLLLACVLVSGHAFADRVTVNGVVYDVVKKAKIATIVDGKSCTGDVVIPEYITFDGIDCIVKEIGEKAFYVSSFSGSQLHSLSLPNSITTIGNEAFHNCSLSSINLPENLITIGEYAFWDCSSLKEIILPEGLTSVGENAFDGCSSLTCVSTPASLTEVPYGMFVNCESLTKITFAGELKDIGSYAFRNCQNIEDVYCYATIPPSLSYPYFGTFYGSYIEYATLHVPTGSIDAYKSATGWGDFGSIVALKEEGQCAKPVISYEDGKLEFTSSTSGAQFYYTIADEDVVTEQVSGGSVNLNATLNISVYAEANGYTRSETATATLCWIDGTLNTSGIDAARVEMRPVIVSANGSNINVKGVSAGERVTVYSVNGVQLGSAIAQSQEVSVSTRTLDGNIAIIKIGENSIKIKLK